VNIALGALILALLIFPAISFRFAINKSSQLKELVGTISITDSFWAFLFIPIFIHGFIISVIHFLLAKWLGEIKFDVIYELIIGNKDFVVHNREFYKFVIQFLVYNWVCIFFGYLIGYVFAKWEDKVLVSENNISKRFTLSKLLGLDKNNWYSLLDGQSNLVSGVKAKIETIDLVIVNILSHTKETTVIYSGIVYDYYFKPNSKELGYLVLQNARRRDLRMENTTLSDEAGQKTTNSYSNKVGKDLKIQGEYFIIPMEQIVNINVTYVRLSNMATPVESKKSIDPNAGRFDIM
jgi:hypothetical protein